ncbi:hypothetical protein MMC13_006896 [Lambiella insularis]|nr:hypothetical protein [Lambiella insularis]
MSTTTSLNLPQLLFVLLVSGVAIRYFFFRSSNPNANIPTSLPGSSSRSSRAANPQHVEQIAQMFPQVGRREIMWDLQRNGGSVAATTERILSRGLETPPPSFQPPSLASSTPAPISSSTAAPQPVPQNLIARYNLSSKIQQIQLSQLPKTASDSSSSKTAGWSTNKNERQALLQKRREEMILSARRKMEEKDRKPE